MPFKVGDEVVLATKNPSWGIDAFEVLSEIGIIVRTSVTYGWIVDFPSHRGFYACDSDLAAFVGRNFRCPRPTADSKSFAKVLKQWKLDKTLNLTTLAADFYTLIDLQCDYPEELKILLPLNNLANLLATQFSAYLDMVIGGELRHARNNVYYMTTYGDRMLFGAISDIPISSSAAKILEAFEDKPCTGRNAVWIEWQAIRKAYGIKALESAIEIFKLDWESGYGGESWARATAILIDYLEGGLTDLAFVDTCFGLHHNNNIILDKVWVIDRKLKDVLDYNLRNKMDYVAEYCSPEVETLRRRFK